MQKLAIWAGRNTLKARLLIIAGFLLIYVTGVITARLLSGTGITFSEPLALVCGSAFLLLSLAYPYPSQKKGWRGRAYFTHTKTLRFFINLCTFSLIIFSAQHQKQLFRDYSGLIPSAAAISLPGDSLNRTYLDGKTFAGTMRDENGKLLKWKERKLLLKKQIKSERQSSDISTGGKVALIILCVLLAAGLAFGIAVLSCSLACADQGILAVLVALGGAFLIGWGLVKVIRAINRKQPSSAASPDR